MTKKLDETFGFEQEEYPDIEPEQSSRSTSVIDDEITLDSGIIDHEQEMNEIHKLALQAHKDTLTSGLSLDPKMSGPLLSASTQYLDIALKASRSKIDKKLSLIKLKNPVVPSQIAQSEENTEVLEGGVLMDRNQLLDTLLNDDKNLNTKK